MILRRVLSIIPILIIVTFLVTSLTTFLPGDVASTLAGPTAGADRIAEVRDQLRLDDSVFERWWNWASDAIRGDLGTSFFSRRAVTRDISDRWTITASLVVGAALVAILIGVPLGIIAGYRKGGWVDRLATLIATIGVSIPHFVIGIFLLVMFAIWLDWLPFAGYSHPSEDGWAEWAKHLAIPVLALSAAMIAELARQIRSSLAETLEQDYIRTARAKGLPTSKVVLKHGLRLAILPAVSVMAVQLTRLFGGAVVIELVFNLGGLGSYMFDAILTQDIPVIQGLVPLAVVLAVTLGVVADLLFLVLYPALRKKRGST